MVVEACTNLVPRSARARALASVPGSPLDAPAQLRQLDEAWCCAETGEGAVTAASGSTLLRPAGGEEAPRHRR